MTPSLKAALEWADGLDCGLLISRNKVNHVKELAIAVLSQAQQIAALEAKLEEANKRIAEIEQDLPYESITEMREIVRQRDEARAVARRLLRAINETLPLIRGELFSDQPERVVVEESLAFPPSWLTDSEEKKP